MEKHVKRSVVPIYLVGAVWLAYALLFPLYQPVHYLLCGALSAAAFIVGKGLFPNKVYEVPGEPEENKQEEPEKKEPPKSTGDPEIDALINKAGGENADHGNAEGDPLYTYVYWQETTLHAGEDPDAEREYLEVFRTQVRQGSNAVTTEVLSDTLEGVGSFVGVEGLGGLLTFTAEVPRETADALRDPAQFAGA